MARTGRPKGTNNKEVNYTLRLDEATNRRLLAYCDTLRISRSEAIREAIGEMDTYEGIDFEEDKSDSKQEIVVFEDGNLVLDVPINYEQETVWLTSNQMARLFERDEKTIRKHVNNVFASGEVSFENNTQKMRVDGVKQMVNIYSLDVILAVGYRVNSSKGIVFRRWANSVLKQYLIQGYAVNERRLEALQKTVKIVYENALENFAGNAAEYSLDRVAVLENSPLKGKRILFLGSSVTRGACSLDTSMADYIGKIDGAIVTKEAVSGTTLVTSIENNYIERMKALDTEAAYDIIVVQLSTNDATRNIPLGTISDSFDGDRFDTTTVAGAIEYIIAYCKATWGCQVVFYTGTKYDSENYANMVKCLFEIRGKWGIHVIDLWNDAKMCAVSEADYALYMYDCIHPSRAGYLHWWTPKFREILYQL